MAKSKTRLINCCLCLASILAALAIGEFVARLAGYEPYPTPQGFPEIFQYDAVLGWSQRPQASTVVEHPRFTSHVRINSGGLRDKEYPYLRSPGIKRILVLGDSFSWGWGVEAEETFPDLLEGALHNVEVINAGVPGYSTDQELIWLEREGLKYQPDLVILQFFENDVKDNNAELVAGVFYKPKFVLEPDGTLRLTGVPCPKASVIRWLGLGALTHSSIVNLIMSIVSPNILAEVIRSGPEAAALWTSLAIPRLNPRLNDPGPCQAGGVSRYEAGLTLALIKRIRELVTDVGAHLLILTDCREGNPCICVADHLRRENFPLVVLTEKTGFRNKLMTISKDGHWNRAGHQYAARSILNYLKSNPLLGD